MAVIINDFEIIAEPPASPPSGSGASEGQAQATPAFRPEDIERILRHFEARRQRLLAD